MTASDVKRIIESYNSYFTQRAWTRQTNMVKFENDYIRVCISYVLEDS